MKYRLTITDLVIGSLLVLTGLFFVYRIKVGLNYNWAWDLIPQFIFRFDEKSEQWVSGLLMTGFYTTIRLSFWGIILATFFGVITGVARTSNILFLRWLATTYVETMRNLPPLVIIFIVYFFIGNHLLPYSGIGDALQGKDNILVSLVRFCFAPPEHLTTFLSALFTLAIFEGAYITEIVRAGIQSINKGQWEAAHSLGMTKYQQMRHIILPQAIGVSIPPLLGQAIVLVKDSALLSLISVMELTRCGQTLTSERFMPTEAFFTVAFFYLCIYFVLKSLADWSQKKLIFREAY